MPVQPMGFPNKIISSAADFYDTADITANTNIRDVSEMLDLWVHRRTPLLNLISWGEGSGGLKYEWIYEHLGYGYIKSVADITGDADVATFEVETSDLGSTSEAIKQVQQGALLMAWSSAQATHVLYFCATMTGVDTLELTALITGTVDAGEKWWILGNWVNEGSEPRSDISRARTLVENDMAILRKDIQITGSMAATDMYAVPNELRHQTRLRLLEMQREREMAVFFSMASSTSASARATTDAALFRGLYSFLNGAPSGAIDSTTTSLTESAFNNLVAAVWDWTAVFGSATQIRKFTEWDKSRVRTTPRDNLGGHHITSYLTDIGIEVDLYPVMQFPSHFLFVLDTEMIKLIPKKGRKLIIEKLGKTGDYDRYQMLSEFTLYAKGHAIGELGGCFDKLT